MRLRLTPTTAELLGETAAEWQLLEKQVRAGSWTCGARGEEPRLRALAAQLRVVLHIEELPVLRRRLFGPGAQ